MQSLEELLTIALVFKNTAERFSNSFTGNYQIQDLPPLFNGTENEWV